MDVPDLFGSSDIGHSSDTLLHAVREDDFFLARKALTSGASPAAHPSRSIGPLHSAASRGHTRIVGLLLGAGAPVNQQSKHGRSALHRAAVHGHVDVMELLLGAGKASPDARDDYGEAALHAAAASGIVEAVHVLLDHGAHAGAVSTSLTTPLHLASAHGYTDSVSALLKAGAPPHQATDHGVTPLHSAAKNGHVEIVRLLLEDSRVDVSAQDSHGRRSPLHWAAMFDHFEIVGALLSAGAKRQLEDVNGNHPVHVAVSQNAMSVVVALLDDASLINRNGVTPGMLAAAHCRADMVAAFLESSLIAVDPSFVCSAEKEHEEGEKKRIRGMLGIN